MAHVVAFLLAAIALQRKVPGDLLMIEGLLDQNRVLSTFGSPSDLAKGLIAMGAVVRLLGAKTITESVRKAYFERIIGYTRIVVPMLGCLGRDIIIEEVGDWPSEVSFVRPRLLEELINMLL